MGVDLLMLNDYYNQHGCVWIYLLGVLELSTTTTPVIFVVCDFFESHW